MKIRLPSFRSDLSRLSSFLEHQRQGKKISSCLLNSIQVVNPYPSLSLDWGLRAPFIWTDMCEDRTSLDPGNSLRPTWFNYSQPSPRHAVTLFHPREAKFHAFATEEDLTNSRLRSVTNWKRRARKCFHLLDQWRQTWLKTINTLLWLLGL